MLYTRTCEGTLSFYVFGWLLHLEMCSFGASRSHLRWTSSAQWQIQVGLASRFLALSILGQCNMRVHSSDTTALLFSIPAQTVKVEVPMMRGLRIAHAIKHSALYCKCDYCLPDYVLLLLLSLLSTHQYIYVYTSRQLLALMWHLKFLRMLLLVWGLEGLFWLGLVSAFVLELLCSLAGVASNDCTLLGCSSCCDNIVTEAWGFNGLGLRQCGAMATSTSLCTKALDR